MAMLLRCRERYASRDPAAIRMGSYAKSVDTQPLITDHGLYLAAVEVLDALEQTERPFDIWSALDAYLDSEEYQDRFPVETGVAFDGHRQHARGFVAAAYVPNDDHAHLRDYRAEQADLAPSVAEFIRIGGWTFWCAWTQRYGGPFADWRKRFTLIKPWSDE